MKTSKLATLTLGAALVLLFTGCAPGGTTTDLQPTSSQESASVAPGATVTIINMDSSSHTVTSDDGSSFDVAVSSDGGTGTFTAPTKPGSYPDHCGFHPSMYGTLIVK